MEQKTLTLQELVRRVHDMGYNGGGEIEVTGMNNDEEFAIIIAQTEWHGSPVCLVGGYGGTVVAINRDDVKTRLDTVLDDFFDKESTFTVNDLSAVEDFPALQSEDESTIEVCECCGGRDIAPDPYDDGWSTRTWCPDCEEDHYATNLKEYKEAMETWWESLDEQETKRLAEGAENCRVWWQSLSFDQKRSLYKKIHWDNDK